MKRTLFLLFSTIPFLLPTLCVAQMDKAIHASAGFGITITVAAATNKPKLALLTGIGVGVGKELWDAGRPGHQASAMDCLASTAASSGAYAIWRYVLNRHRPVKLAGADSTQRAASTPPPDAPGSQKTSAPQAGSSGSAASADAGGGQH